MKQLTAQMTDQIAQKHGSKPMFLLGIQWVPNGEKILYADRDLVGTQNRILELDRLDTALKLSGTGDSIQITVKLDDTDGVLKELLNAVDIQNRPCWVYQHFEDLTLAHKFLVLAGNIVTPIEWNEGDRTLTFNVLTQLNDVEAAFSMEEGDFPQIPEDTLGKVWPLIFGTVCNMQAVQVRSPRKGYLLHGEGIHDFTLEPRICQAHYLECANIKTGEETNYTFKDYAPGTDPTSADSYEFASTTTTTYGPDPSCVQDRFETICNLEDLLMQQKVYEHATIQIKNGEAFPQNQLVTIYIDGAKFTGTFANEVFTITDRKHPDYDDPEKQAICQSVDTYHYGGWDRTHFNSNWQLSGNGATWFVAKEDFVNEDCGDLGTWTQTPLGGQEASERAFNDMPEADFCWLPAGSEVYLETEAEVLYIVSLLPGTVNNVAAYRKQKTTGRELLMTVPTDLYTVYETDYVGYQVVEIGFEKQLSQIDDTWGDDIYVSFTSSVGPNPVDIIEWLIIKYTILDFDDTSRSYVRDKMLKYPSNFWLKERLNVWQLIQDIAHQSRCAVYIRDGVVYIKYLAEEPTSVVTLTSSDILINSLKMSLTETENLATKFLITWRDTEAAIVNGDLTENKFMLKFNVPKYGIQPQEEDYYTQNTFPSILKSATFWLIRNANTWKRIEFDTPLTTLNLDLFDCVTLNLPRIFTGATKVIIVGMQYDAANNLIHFICETPIRSGEGEPYVYYWPANMQAAIPFPLYEQDLAQAGGGYNFTVTPPLEHLLRSTGNLVSIQSISGDKYPSDLDDILPTVTCKISDVMDIVEEDPAFKALEFAKKNTPSSPEKEPTGGSGSSAGGSRPPKDCNGPCGICQELGGTCVYMVSTTTIYPILRGQGSNGCTGPCSPGGNGIVCTGIVRTCTYCFDTYDAAASFRNNQQGNTQYISCFGRNVSTGGIQSVSGISSHATPDSLTRETPTCVSESSGLPGSGAGGLPFSKKCTCVNAILGGGASDC